MQTKPPPHESVLVAGGVDSRKQRTDGDGSMNFRFRYASTLGDRYALPVYFNTLGEALTHQGRSDAFLGDLPGHDSMRIEELIAGEWVAV